MIYSYQDMFNLFGTRKKRSTLWEIQFLTCVQRLDVNMRNEKIQAATNDCFYCRLICGFISQVID